MRFIILILIIFVCYSLAAAQATKGKELLEITSDDFSRTRSLTEDILGSKSVFVFKKPTYKLKRIVKPKKPVAAKKAPPAAEKTAYKLPADTKSPEVWKRLGVTIWRLAADKVGGDTGNASLSPVCRRDREGDRLEGVAIAVVFFDFVEGEQG